MLHVVLHQPEIPHNTGAVGRLCLAAGARLHLIKPLGFSLEDKYVRRVGLDYWQDVDLHVWENFSEFRASMPPGAALWLFTTKATQAHWDTAFSAAQEVYLMFGCETRGLPESILHELSDRCRTIPMEPGSTRSLNLATAAGIVLYEALRQRRPASGRVGG